MMSDFLRSAKRHLPEAHEWLNRLRGQPSNETWREFHAWLMVGAPRLAALLLTGENLTEIAEREVHSDLECPILALLLRICLQLIERDSPTPSPRSDLRLN